VKLCDTKTSSLERLGASQINSQASAKNGASQ
jgi:hypothetical protein